MTRQRILDAATHELSRKGYAGLRMTSVAREARLQTSAIYYHFPSRDDLIEEVMRAGIAGTREHLMALLSGLPDGMSALERLLAAVATHTRHVLDVPNYTTVSIRYIGQMPERIRRSQLLEEERYGEIWRRLISDMVCEGSLRADLDPYLARMLVLGALNSTVEWWNPRRESVDAMVANAQSLIRHGLTSPGRDDSIRDEAIHTTPQTNSGEATI